MNDLNWSLDELALRRWAGEMEFKPLRKQPIARFVDEAESLQPSLRWVLSRLRGDSSDRTILGSTPWPAEVLDFYYRQAPSLRRAALIARMVPVHEALHQLDSFFSPYGASYAVHAAQQAIGFLRDAPFLVADMQRQQSSTPLSALMTTDGAYRTAEGIPVLATRSEWLAAANGSSGAERNLLTLGPALDYLAGRFEPVSGPSIPITVRSLEDGLVLWPVSILEGRAIAASALNLFTRLGGDRQAAEEVVEALEWFYSPSENYPNYVLLQNLMQSAFKPIRREDQSVDRDAFVAIMHAILLCGWFALQSPAHTPRGQEPSGAPALRFCLAVKELRLRSGTVESEPFLHELQQILDAGNLEASLTRDESVIIEVRNSLDQLAPSWPLREHFKNLLAFHAEALASRATTWSIALGVPLTGDIEAFVGSLPEALQASLYADAEVPSGLDEYLRLQDNLFNRRARPMGIWDSYWANVVGPAGSAKARADAVAESRAAAEVFRRSAWPLEPSDHGTVRFAFPPDWLPPADEMNLIDARVSWGVLARGVMTHIFLEIDFGDRCIEPIHACFSVPQHTAALQRVIHDNCLILVWDGSGDVPLDDVARLLRFSASFREIAEQLDGR